MTTIIFAVKIKLAPEPMFGSVQINNGYTAMSIWQNSKFWVAFIALFLPALFVFALPTAIFIHPDTGAVVGITLFLCQAVLTCGVPYVLARRIALKHVRENRGFEVLPPDTSRRDAV